MELYIGIGIIGLLIVYIFFAYNQFVRSNNEVKEAFSTMDVYLKRRWDLIPNIVEAVKGYSEHEKNTLVEVINLRNSNYDNMNDKEKIQTNEQLTRGISRIMMLAESYPELKASENFMNLSEQLTKTEDNIAQARKYYNANVREFNNKVEMFPSNIIAKLFNYNIKPFFEADANERENVKVEL